VSRGAPVSVQMCQTSKVGAPMGSMGENALGALGVGGWVGREGFWGGG